MTAPDAGPAQDRATVTAFTWCASVAELAEVIERLAAEDAASLPLLDAEGCARLCAAAESLAYRPGRPVIGSGEKAVRQDFDVALDFPPNNPIHAFTAALQALLAEALVLAPLLEEVPDFRLNDLIVQRYRSGSFGITPHRDHLRYRGLVAIVTLRGAAPFFVCADRLGKDAREVPAGAGRLVLMRAPGYRAPDPRPFHYLGNVTEERLSLGLRYDVERPEPGPSRGGGSR